MAVVQLQFQKDVDDPLKPLRDDISDGYFGMFKVEKQLDLNPSMFDPLTIFGLFTRNILEINQMYIWRSVSFLHMKLMLRKKGFKTTTFETLICRGTTITSFMKLHELRSHPFVLSLELLCEKKSTQHRQHSEKS